jgi:hypothetical protein
MTCERQPSSGESDSLEVKAAIRPLDKSATAWLLGQAVRYLNTAGKEGEFEYARVVEILRRCSGDLPEAVTGIFLQVKGGDTTLRWNLLYVLGDAGDESAADFLVGAALKPLPEKKDGEGCESDQDMEMLVSTGAVHALHRVATRYPQAADHVLQIIAKRPAQPILIEAVKVAADLGLRERVQELLPEEDRWILDIRRALPQELFAEAEREDGKERGFTPPKSGSLYTAPKVVCCQGNES